MRTIDADALKIAIIEEGQRSKRYKMGEFWELNREEIWKVIDCMPTIEERKTGEWINGNEGKWNTVEVLKCSVCGEMDNRMYRTDKFCPNCGAKMEVDDG